MTGTRLFAWFVLGGGFILLGFGLAKILGDVIVDLEAEELAGFPAAAPSLAAVPGLPDSSTCPESSRGAGVFDQDRLSENAIGALRAVADLTAGGGEGCFGEVVPRTHSLSHLYVGRHRADVRYKAVCTCGVSMTNLKSRDDAEEWVVRHGTIEEWLESMTGASDGWR